MLTYKKYFLIVILLVIPFAGFWASNYLKKHHDSSFYTSLEKQLNKTRAEIKSAGITPTNACSNKKQNAGIVRFCKFYNKIAVLKTISIYALILGFGLLIFIKLAGFLCRSSRSIISVIFPLTLWLSLLALAISILLQTAIIIFCVFLFEILVIKHKFHLGFVEGIGVLGILLSFGMIGIAISTIKNQKSHVTGLKINKTENPKLFGLTDNISKKCNSPFIVNIIVSSNNSCYLTNAKIKLPDCKKRLSGISLIISLRLLEILNTDELTALLRHKLEQYKCNQVPCPQSFYLRIVNLLESLRIDFSDPDKDASRQIALYPVFLTLEYCLNSFKLNINRSDKKQTTSKETSNNLSNALLKMEKINTSLIEAPKHPVIQLINNYKQLKSMLTKKD